MSISAHIYQALPFSKSSRIVPTALVSAYHVMLISFQPCSACGPILISFSACESELRDSIKTVPHRAQCWSCPQERAGSHAADRPDYGQRKRRSNGEFHARYGTCITERPGLVERPAPLWGAAIVEQEQHNRLHQLYKSRQWDGQLSMPSAFYSHMFLPGRLSLTKASLSKLDLIYG